MDQKLSKRGKRDTQGLRQELVTHFRGERHSLRREWVHQMTAKKLLEGMTPQETEAESATIYDTCVECIETAHYDSAEAYAKKMAERGVLRGMTSEQILGGMLTLRDVYGRSLFGKYRTDMAKLTAALDVYEPVANNIIAVVAMAFIRERENVVSQQQEAIRELSTPVLQVREGLLILPIIGLIDSLRARQLTEQLLRAIRANRAKAVVVDITGVPAVDSKIANHLLQTVDAARLMGARVIVTGLSPDVAQALVYIGVDLTRLKTVGDLQGGIEEADKFLGYKVNMVESTAAASMKG
ncbi:MAG: STAS domain-containing protein [Syntrophales bacterium]|nr:STAS domain-containing protein [Syntrophales bacterium]